MPTTVVHLRPTKGAVYIARGPCGTHILNAPIGKRGGLANPHPIGLCDLCRREHRRAGSITAFRRVFLERMKNDQVFREAVLQLKGKSHAIGTWLRSG